MRKGIFVIPSIVTLMGMFAGFYAILSALEGKYVHSAWAIIIAGLFDGMDGWVARLTHTTTKFGIELDSLSDVIAFGVAPATLMFTWALMPFGRLGWAAVFLFMACGAMRLARFNIQMGSSEKKSFTGMPIPAAAGILAATLLFYTEMGLAHEKSLIILIMTIFLALLMVSTLRYHGQKEIDMKKRKPFRILVIVVIMAALIIIRPEMAIFSFAMIYLWSGIIENAYLFFIKKEPL
jgi:CDP-diacylglycerol--serine O-phosphatidyltransferase